MNKTELVLEHLKKHKAITSWEAIEKFGATRLSAIIYNLRTKYEIDTIMFDDIDRYGNKVTFGKYIYKGEKKRSE